MRIKMLGNADGMVDGARKALFAGQSYDVMDDDAERLIKLGAAEGLAGEVPASGKQVPGPPNDKAVRTRRTKAG